MTEYITSSIELEVLTNEHQRGDRGDQDVAEPSSPPQASCGTDVVDSNSTSIFSPTPAPSPPPTAPTTSTAALLSIIRELKPPGFVHWIGAIVGIGAILVAIYYGYRSLQLQRWSAHNDFWGSCAQARISTNFSSGACEGVLSLSPVPPPFGLRNLAERAFACVALKEKCGVEEDLSSKEWEERSLTGHPNSYQPRSWAPFGIYILVIITVQIAAHLNHKLQLLLDSWITTSISLLTWVNKKTPSCRLLQPLLLRIPWITFNILLFLSCCSPLYALNFWVQIGQQQRTAKRYPSGLWMTLWGGAFCAFYVYNWSVAWNLQLRIAEREWNNDLQSLESQRWRTPENWHAGRDFDHFDSTKSNKPSTSSRSSNGLITQRKLRASIGLREKATTASPT